MSTRVQISMRYFLWFTYVLPCFALFSCVGLSLLKDFEKSTRTHCQVFNFLPSISASIGDCEPQRYIWRFCFALDSVPRYVVAFLQLRRLLNRHHMVLPELYQLFQLTNTGIHVLELTFLLILTYVSSTEVHWAHEYSFIGFMVCSLVHMLLTILIDYFWPRTMNYRLSDQEILVRGQRCKWFFANIFCFFMSLYFYFRHNDYCEPYMYSGYCFFEYIVVLTNIAYHSVVMYEWDQNAGQIQFFY